MIHRSHKGERQPLTSLDDLRGVVAGEVIDAAKAASEQFRRANIPHTIVGGLAVGMGGWPRATGDVDIFVGDEAFVHDDQATSQKAGLPIRWNDVTIDWVSGDTAGALDAYKIVPAAGEFPVAPAKVIVYMKLIAGRMKDKTDVVELIKSGINLDETRDFIEAYQPRLLNELERLIDIASKEPT